MAPLECREPLRAESARRDKAAELCRTTAGTCNLPRALNRLLARGLADLLLHLAIVQPALRQVAAEPDDRRPRLPVGALAVPARLGRRRVAVLGIVVARGVRADPVRHGLDYRRPALVQRDLARAPHGGVDGERVVAVDPNRGHAEGDAARRDAVAWVWARRNMSDVGPASRPPHRPRKDAKRLGGSFGAWRAESAWSPRGFGGLPRPRRPFLQRAEAPLYWSLVPVEIA